MQGQQAAVDLLEREAWRQSKETQRLRALLSVSGIGRILGLTIVLETGPIERFAGVGWSPGGLRSSPATPASNSRANAASIALASRRR